MKKTLSLILALMMMLSCFGAFAEGDSSGESGGDRDPLFNMNRDAIAADPDRTEEFLRSPVAEVALVAGKRVDAARDGYTPYTALRLEALDCQFIEERDRLHDAFDVVISVGTLRRDVEPEIYLCRGF